jgi:hypothetical protein
MAQVNDALLQAIQRLEQALAAEAPGQGPAWAEQVDTALAQAERALQEENAEADSPKGVFKAVDMTRPALVRRVAELRQALAQDVGEAASLRSEVQAAAHASRTDFGALRNHLREFVRALRSLKEGEIDVVQESVTTDLGAGD